jgi:hypothetical protein
MNVDVVVVRTPKGYLVRPGYVIARRGDSITWKNCTQAPIEVLLPRHYPGRDTLRQLNRRGETRIRVPRNAPLGFFPYNVYSVEANDLCIGESTPGVIIKG